MGIYKTGGARHLGINSKPNLLRHFGDSTRKAVFVLKMNLSYLAAFICVLVGVCVCSDGRELFTAADQERNMQQKIYDRINAKNEKSAFASIMDLLFMRDGK